MNISDYINVGLFSVLLGFKTARYAAASILIGYALYHAAVVPLPGEYYYHVTALLNLIIGCVLFPKYKLVAILSFSLIIVCNLGYMLYESGFEPTLYNDLSLVIIITQIILLYIRALTDGYIIRGTRGRALVWLANCDRFQQSFTSLPKKAKDKR